jgi:hypothetical protein
MTVSVASVYPGPAILAPGDLISAHGLTGAAEVAVRHQAAAGLPGRPGRETRLLRRL